MSVLLEFAMFPTDKGDSVSPYVSRIIKMIHDSGLPYQLTPMGTIIEFPNMNDALQMVGAAYAQLEPDCKRVYSSLKFDIQEGKDNRIYSKVKSIEDKIGPVKNKKMLEKTPYTFDRVFRMALSIVFVVIFIWLLDYLSDVLVPFAIAILIAYIINPVVLLFNKILKRRSLAVFMALLSITLAMIGILALVLPMLFDEIKHISDILTKFVETSHLSEKASKSIPPDIWKFIEGYVSSPKIRDFFTEANFFDLLEKVMNKLMPGIVEVLDGTSALITGVVSLFIVILYLIFILIDYDDFMESWQQYIPSTYRNKVLGVIRDFDVAMNKYFRKQALVASILGILFSIGFTIIGLPMGIFLGILIGMLSMVPYLMVLGMVPAFLLGCVYTLETGEAFWFVMAKIGAVFFIVEIINDGFLVPRIMGKLTGLKPAIILLSISIWGKLLGFLGLIIALPITCLLIAYYQRFLSKKNEL